jgi:hypothetical protein
VNKHVAVNKGISWAIHNEFKDLNRHDFMLLARVRLKAQL